MVKERNRKSGKKICFRKKLEDLEQFKKNDNPESTQNGSGQLYFGTNSVCKAMKRHDTHIKKNICLSIKR